MFLVELFGIPALFLLLLFVYFSKRLSLTTCAEVGQVQVLTRDFRYPVSPNMAAAKIRQSCLPLTLRINKDPVIHVRVRWVADLYKN